MTCCIATVADLVIDSDTGLRGMSDFAQDFYEELLDQDKSRSVGQAMREARLRDYRRHGLVWTKYALLGNPATRIVPR